MAYMNGVAVVGNFRRVATAGLAAGHETVIDEFAGFLSALPDDPEFSEIVQDRDRLLDPAFRAEILSRAAKSTMEQAIAGVDSASIVFIHSLVDALAHELLRVCAIASPEDWSGSLRERKVSLAEVQSSDSAAILAGLIQTQLLALERESLIKKSDTLHALCQPPAGWTNQHGFRFDRTELGRIDDLRHSIVHGDLMGRPIPGAEQAIDYLRQCGLHFVGLANLKYKVQLTEEHLAEALSVFRPSADAEPEAGAPPS